MCHWIVVWQEGVCKLQHVVTLWHASDVPKIVVAFVDLHNINHAN